MRCKNFSAPALGARSGQGIECLSLTIIADVAWEKEY